MKSIRVLCVLASLSCFSLIGCGDDNSNNDSGGSADAKAAIASCEKLCVAKDAKQCDSGGLTMTVDECKEWCQIIVAVPANCAAKYKAYGECTDGQADACAAEENCSAQLEAANNCK